MGLRIIYGKPGTGKSDFCFSQIADLIDKEKKIYIITPEQFSFTTERKLIDCVKKDAVINAKATTLSRLAYMVMNEIGGANNVQLSKCGKSMIIYSILNKYKKELKFLGKSDENIELSMNTIKEFKKHGITIESLKEETKNTEDNYLKSKLQDMTLIYEKFEEQIQNKYIEETDLLNILSQNLQQTNIIKDSIIYLDEFAGFTGQEYEVIKKLIEQAKQVNITMCIDDLDINTNPDTDIFYSNKQTLKKILNIVKENGFNLEEPVFLNNTYRFKTEELKYLSENISSIKINKFNKETKNIQLFLAQNPYSEIEQIAKQITKLVRDENLRYKEIAIIAKNIDEYSSLVRSIFSKYEIPVFIDEKRDLNQNIITQYILSIIEILNKNFSTESIFFYLKSGFCDIEKDEIFKLENYCTKWGIKQNKWKKEFTHEKENVDKAQEIERLNELRKEIVEPLLDLKKKIDSEKTAKNISKCLYEFLNNQNIEEKIQIKVNELQEQGLIELAEEYIQSYKTILEILDEIVLAFGEDKITIDKYGKILKVGMQNSELGRIPGTQDQVTFADVERSRSHKVKTVFLIGVNDGQFPSINKDEGFFNDEDREYLKNKGLEIAKGTTENLYEENFEK